MRQRLPLSFRFPAEVAANGHNSAPFRFVVAATCGPRAAAGSARGADASLSQLPQEGSRRLFARFCASCRRHYQRAAAVSCRGGGRRPRYRLRFAPALRAEIQRGSSVQQSHTLLLLYSPIFVLAAATERRGEARLARCGLPPLVATSWACAISPTQCVFTHTEPTHRKRQAAAGSLARSTLAACRHEPLSESARRSPWLPPTAPVPPPRFACFVAGSIEAIRHASISRRGSLCSPMRRLLLAWLRQRHQARRIGSLLVQAPSSGRHAPCRRSGRRASPRGTSAAMAAANSASRAPSARFWCVAVFRKRRPLPASAAVRAVRLLPAANAFRPAHRLPPTPQFSGRGGMVRCGCQRSIA
jgi:hypothetical protein